MSCRSLLAAACALLLFETALPGRALLDGIHAPAGALASAQTTQDRSLQGQLEAVAMLPGEPRIVSAAGMTRRDEAILTLENPSAFETSRAVRRLVIVGGLDGNPDGAQIALDAVRWFKAAAPKADRRQWVVSVLPSADPGQGRARAFAFPPSKGFFDDAEQPESRYIWRWVTYQVPDLVIEVQVGPSLQIHPPPAGSLGAALAEPSNGTGLGSVQSMLVTATQADGAALMRAVLARAVSLEHSALRRAITQRVARAPLALAHVLAERYPVDPGMTYIPSLSWLYTWKLATLTRDESLRAKVLSQVRPWLAGDKPLFGDRIQLNAVAGAMVFAELAKTTETDSIRQAAARLTADGVARSMAEKAPGVALHGFGWSDDMFLGTIVPARAGSPEALDAAGRLLIESARQLQRPDGLFNHAANAPAAWGRGNGFAALGLAETLTALPVTHPARSRVLEVYRRLMAAMKAQQAPDGMWRQVVDTPGSYREETVTALIVTSMARGVRLGWIDRSYVPVIRRGWRALLAHVVDDGTLVDVCVSTGAGPTRRYYLDRPATSGTDDRGGAMALGAALEVYQLTEPR